jgi:Curli production assembly/transport component CsgG/PEGA domain
VTMPRLFCLLAFLFFAAPLLAKDPSVAVITEDLSGELDQGGIEMVESLAESGLSQAPGVSLISRRHLEKVLAEQGLAYNNVVNDRARLGRLAGADILLVVSITKNLITQTRESNTAYGITENIVRSHSDAALAVKAIEVESGRILAQRQFTKRNSGNRRALMDAASQMESALPTISFGELAKDTALPRHKVIVKPTSGGSDLAGLDLFIDGNFIGNTPITTDVEEGVREVSLRKGSSTIWNNRVQILKEVWLTPELAN